MKPPNSQPEARIAELTAQILQHDKWYYEQQKPRISDAAYDALFAELKQLEAEYPLLVLPHSPTQKVAGKAAKGFGKVQHEIALLSLDSLFNTESVIRFDDAIKKDLAVDAVVYACEYKFDGVSVSLEYQNGIFVRGGTRGDGLIGEDITQNLRTIKTLPQVLRTSSPPKKLILRGEVLMPLQAFSQLNKSLIEQGHEPFANPRNATSGSLRQLDSAITATRPLALYCYDVLSHSDDFVCTTQAEVISKLRELGFVVGDYHPLAEGPAAVFDCHAHAASVRNELPFEIDGLVFKVNRLDWQKKLGYKSRSPHFAFAYKFAARTEWTTLLDVAFQVGRTGVITPVAILQPIDVGGVTVSRATLHNFDQIEKLGVRLGAQVQVARAGDVIPAIVAVQVPHAKSLRPIAAPAVCPACQTPLISDQVALRCPNTFACPAQIKGRLIHFASKRALDIQGLGEETVAQLLDSHLIAKIEDLFFLTKEQLLTLEGFKDKKAENLIAAIKTCHQKHAAKQLFALGIFDVGEQVAKWIWQHFGSIELIQNATQDELQAIHGVGPEIAKSLRLFFAAPANQALVHTLTQFGFFVAEAPTVAPQNLPYQGFTFVVTGEFDNWSRDAIKTRLGSLGAKTPDSVSKKTQAVFAGENAGSKLAKAITLNVPQLDAVALELALTDPALFLKKYIPTSKN